MTLQRHNLIFTVLHALENIPKMQLNTPIFLFFFPSLNDSLWHCFLNAHMHVAVQNHTSHVLKDVVKMHLSCNSFILLSNFVDLLIFAHLSVCIQDLFNVCVKRAPSRRCGVNGETGWRADRWGIRNPRSACILLNHCTVSACLQRRDGEREGEERGDRWRDQGGTNKEWWEGAEDSVGKGGKWKRRWIEDWRFFWGVIKQF